MGPLNNNINVGVVTMMIIIVFTFHLFGFVSSQGSTWLTLDGNAPLVIARGGFSGLFPDSSNYAYNLASATSVPDVVLWCDVQLSKDAVGVCFPDINLQNSSNVNLVYPNRGNTYNVDGVNTEGYFSIDFTIKELLNPNVSLAQGIYSRSPVFDGSGMQIQTVSNVFTQNKPAGFWLNIQHDAFYTQHKLSMRKFVIDSSKSVIISHISSPEVRFLQSLVGPFARTKTKLVFRFLDQGDTESSTNQTYGSLLKNLTFVKTFASGILVPKSYIWPVDASYLQPHTTLVTDAHKIGLAVYAAGFANDVVFAYNYSYNPISEYLSFIDDDDFSVDGVISDFPITPSAARDCFAHLGKNASGEAKPLVISHRGASGDLPPCTDIAYKKAISDGADVIDCPVQMSNDGIPFCLSSINLMNSTMVSQTRFRANIQTVSVIQPKPGIFSFSMNWTDIQVLTPLMVNPFPDFLLYRNPKFRNTGKLISLSDFLDLAKNSITLSGVLINIENADYLAKNKGMSVIQAVETALEKAGFNNLTNKKVMIQSSESSVLKDLKGKKYELVYEVKEQISGVQTDSIQDIKSFADSVVVFKGSVFSVNSGFLVTLTDVVSRLQSFKLQVYVQTFCNEFVTQAYDFFSDPIVEINSFVTSAKIDGVITDFPLTAATYKKNSCLKMKEIPIYMSAVAPGQLFQLMAPQLMPPAEAPNPLLTVADVTDPPLPPVKPNATAPAPSPPATPPSPSDQERITASTILSCLPVIVAALLFW